MKVILKRTTKIGNVMFEFRIIDGIASLRTNDDKITRQLYEQALKDGKPNILWDEPSKAFIEKFEGLRDSQIWFRLKHDLELAEKQKNKSMKETKEKMAKEKK